MLLFHIIIFLFFNAITANANDGCLTLLRGREVYQKNLLKNSVSIEQGIRGLLQKGPTAKIIAIGETHGNPNHHLRSIEIIKKDKPEVDTLFLEVSATYNRLFVHFFDNQISFEEIRPVLERDFKLSLHITQEILDLTKRLGIRIVGVEMLNPSASALPMMFNLSERNQYTSQKMLEYLSYVAPAEKWLKDHDYSKGLFSTKAAIYIGGAGHIHYRSSRVASVTDLLEERGINLLKILTVTPESMEWDWGKLIEEAYVAPDVKSDFAFFTASPSPLLLPSMPIIDSSEVHWHEYDLIIGYSNKKQ